MDHLPLVCVEEESVLVRKLILASVFLGDKTDPSCAVDVVRCLSTCLLLQSEVALVDVSGQRDRTGLVSYFEKMFLMVCHLWSGSSICSLLPVVQGK